MNHLLTEVAAAAWGGGLAGTVSMAASAAGRWSAGMRMTLQRAASASAPAARRPAWQNWATWPVVPHLEQRRREASVWTSILMSSASTSETKAGSVNPGATAMEMWAMPLAALVKTLSLLRKTRVTRPNWLKCHFR